MMRTWRIPWLALAEDDLAGGEVLDLGPRSEPFQRRLVELEEGLVPAQELRDVVHRHQSLARGCIAGVEAANLRPAR